MKNTKKLVLLLALVLVFVMSIALAACTDPAETTTYSVTVTKGSGVEIDLSTLTAQWKIGDDVKGSKQLDADGKASIDLEPATYTVVITGDLKGYEYPATIATAVQPTVSIELFKRQPQPETATYTITVTGADAGFDYTKVTAVWKSGTETKASKALSADGTASATLEKGNYTVTISGDGLDDYNYGGYNATATDVNATITLTKKAPDAITYTVKVTCNNSDVDLTLFGINWIYSDNSKIQTGILNANGESSADLAPGQYTVRLVILDKRDYYEVDDVTVDADNTHADITLTQIKRDMEVNITSPVALPADVKVKVTVDDEQYGALASIDNNKANIVVPYDGDFSVELDGLPDYLACEPVNGDADSESIALAATLGEVTYTISVYVPTGMNSDDYTVTLLDSEGEEVEDAINLPISAGNATVTLIAGVYKVQINGLNAIDYSYDEVYTSIEESNVNVYITEKFYSVTAGAADPTNIGTFTDEEAVAGKRVKLANVEVTKSYSVMLSSDSADENDESEFTKHNFTISYNGNNAMVGKYTVENGLDSYIVITIDSGKFELIVYADGAFAEEVNISVHEYEVIDKTIELGETKEIYMTNTYDFLSPKANAYLLTVELLGDLVTNDFQISMDEGPVLGKDSNKGSVRTYEFFAGDNESFSIGIYLYKVGTIKVTIEETYGDIILDNETTVTLGGYSQNKSYTFKVPYKGIYQIEIISDNVTPKQIVVSVEGKDPIIDSEHNTLKAEFSAEIGNSYINFTNFEGTSLDGVEITVVVTLVKNIGNILEVGGQNTAHIGGSEAPAKLKMEGIEAGNTYRLLVQWQQPFNKINVISLKYVDENHDEKVYEVRLVGDQESEYYNYYYVEFEAIENEYDIEIYTNGTLIKNVLVKLQKVVAAPGPQVGENTGVTDIGKGSANATELTFSANFAEGYTYTLRLTPDGMMANMASGWAVIYDNTGKEENFVNGSNGWEVTFTANANTTTIKVYCSDTNIMMGVAASIEIVNIVAPVAGPQVGETITITFGPMAFNAGEIVFSAPFVAGKTYTLRFEPTSGPNYWSATYTLLYGEKEETFTCQPAEYFEVTFTAPADGTPVKICHSATFLGDCTGNMTIYAID